MMNNNDDDEQFPLLSAALMAELNKRWPEACPNPRDNEREIWIRVGARNVIRFLNQKFEDQQSSQLEPY